MKRWSNITCVFLLISNYLAAQQTPMYFQYTFNKAGMNPAASGTEIDQENYFAAGINRQWVGMENAPFSSFFNLSYTIRPPRSYRYWQNAGVYLDSDQSGMVSSDNFYGSYTFHMLLRKTHVLSFGVFAGMRSFKKDLGAFDPSDPAVAKNVSALYLYPDIIPGLRYAGKTYFIDFSLRQITITRLKDFKGRRIGGPSKLTPQLYFDAGKKIPVSDFLMMMPSVALNMPLIGPPSVDGNVMFYYANRFGAGLGIRGIGQINATLQIRFFKNTTVGFAYSYPLNSLRYSVPNSIELMVGVVPIGMNAKSSGRHSVAKCPALSY